MVESQIKPKQSDYLIRQLTKPFIYLALPIIPTKLPDKFFTSPLTISQYLNTLISSSYIHTQNNINSIVSIPQFQKPKVGIDMEYTSLS